MGCNGGLMDYAFEYWEENKADLEGDYPYKARNGHCEAKEKHGVVNTKRYHDVKKDNVK